MMGVRRIKGRLMKRLHEGEVRQAECSSPTDCVQQVSSAEPDLKLAASDSLRLVSASILKLEPPTNIVLSSSPYHSTFILTACPPARLPNHPPATLRSHGTSSSCLPASGLPRPLSCPSIPMSDARHALPYRPRAFWGPWQRTETETEIEGRGFGFDSVEADQEGDVWGAGKAHSQRQILETRVSEV